MCVLTRVTCAQPVASAQLWWQTTTMNSPDSVVLWGFFKAWGVVTISWHLWFCHNIFPSIPNAYSEMSNRDCKCHMSTTQSLTFAPKFALLSNVQERAPAFIHPVAVASELGINFADSFLISVPMTRATPTPYIHPYPIHQQILLILAA